MGAFPAAVVMGFLNYVKFSGVASRAEYWYWYLFVFLGAFVTFLIDLVLFHPLSSGSPSLYLSLYAGNSRVEFHDYGPFYIIFALITLVPGLAVTVRRLHDAGYSGLSYFWGFVPIVGPFILLYRLVQPTGHLSRDVYGY